MSIKYPNIWKLNKIILNHQWVKENHAMEGRKYAKLNGNKIECICGTLLKPCIVMNLYFVYIQKEEKLNIINLNLQLWNSKTEKQITKNAISRRQVVKQEHKSMNEKTDQC